MKLISLSFIALGVLAASLTSCDDSAKLAQEIQGTWSGAPETLVAGDASSATITQTYNFMADDDNPKQGSVLVTALVSVTGQLQGVEAVVEPFSLTAGATASMSGRWAAKDDDEIVFAWTDSTLTVNVDPEAVTLSSNVVTGAERPTIDSLKPQIAQSIKAQVAQAVEVRFHSTRKFDDIHFHGDIMSFEVNDKDMTMQKQSL